MCSALISNMTWLGCYTYQQAPREPNGARFVKTRGVFVDIKPTEETLKSPTVTKHKTWGAGPCIKTWGAPLMLDGKVAGAQREYSNRGEGAHARTQFIVHNQCDLHTTGTQPDSYYKRGEMCKKGRSRT